jgi:hypothetical protein
VPQFILRTQTRSANLAGCFVRLRERSLGANHLANQWRRWPKLITTSIGFGLRINQSPIKEQNHESR